MKKIKYEYEIIMTDEDYQDLLDSLDVSNSEELKGALKIITKSAMSSLEEVGMNVTSNIEIEDDRIWLNWGDLYGWK